MALNQAFQAVGRKPILGRRAAQQATEEMLREAASLFAVRRAGLLVPFGTSRAKASADFVPGSPR
jgi:hypothetical protein